MDNNLHFVLLVAWILFAAVIAGMGNKRLIGPIIPFFVSIFLSPIVGLIVVLISKDRQTDRFEKTTTAKSASEELIKINELREKGIVSTDEFDTLKKKIIN